MLFVFFLIALGTQREVFWWNTGLRHRRLLEKIVTNRALFLINGGCFPLFMTWHV